MALASFGRLMNDRYSFFRIYMKGLEKPIYFNLF